MDHRGSAGLLGRENPQNSGGVEFGGWGICGEERGGRVDAKRWEKGGRSPPGYWGLLVRRLGEMVEEMEEENKENQQWGGNCGKWGVKN